MTLFLTTLTVVGTLVGGRQMLRQHHHPEQTSVAHTLGAATGKLLQSRPVRLANQAATRVSSFLIRLDERYQQTLQRQVEALVSQRRHAQWDDISYNNPQREISPEDRIVNRRIARFGGVVVTAALGRLYPPLFWLTGLLAAYELVDRTLWTYQGIKQKRRLKMEHLFVVFLAGVWWSGYFIIGGLSFLAFNLIKKLTLQSQDRTRKEIVSILGQQPHLVWVLQQGMELEVPFEQLQTGDILLLQAGQMIPVDGLIVQGKAAIDQHRLTGESQPLEAGAGDPVLASTVILSGRVQIQVEKTGKATLAAQIEDILANTLEYHHNLETRGEQIADRWVIPSLLMTGLTGATLGLQSAVAVLSNMPGLDMTLLGPMSLLIYLNLASRHHVLIKDGRSLELLQQVDTVIFDKTGTLTLEQPHIRAIHLSADPDIRVDEETVLNVAAAAEQRQHHPVARAILALARERGLTLPDISDTQYEVGYGLRVWLEQDNPSDCTLAHTPALVRVGSARFMALESLTIPTEITALEAVGHESGHSCVMVAVDDHVIGAIELEPTLRPGAAAVIAALHQRNLQTAIISGDQEAPTRALARKLGIERYFANVLPEEKAAFVSQLQAEGRTVCFVGDGINDAIALKQAEVSVSLRGATTIATDMAQIVLMDQTLTNLPVMFDLSHQLECDLKSSLILLTIPCCFVIGGVFLFHAGLLLSSAIYNVTFIASIANAMSPLFRQRHLRDNTQQHRLSATSSVAEHHSAP